MTIISLTVTDPEEARQLVRKRRQAEINETIKNVADGDLRKALVEEVGNQFDDQMDRMS